MIRDRRHIQTHHILYGETPITCRLFQGEHRIITLLNRASKNPPSKAFVELIGIWLITNQGKCIDLDGRGIAP